MERDGSAWLLPKMSYGGRTLIFDYLVASTFDPSSMTIVLSIVNGKQLYQACVIVFNKIVVDNKVDTPSRTVLKLSQDVRPEWRAFYKPPLDKRVADLQWRLLHGAIAVHAITRRLVRNVLFVFHAFLHCVRLRPLFLVLQCLFKLKQRFHSVDFHSWF